MAWYKDAACERCDRGEECWKNEVGGKRIYESFWHFDDEGNEFECGRSGDHDTSGLLSDADYYEGAIRGDV